MTVINKMPAFLLLVLLGLYACNGEQADTQTGTAADTAGLGAEEALAGEEHQKAAANFTAYCAGCHGGSASTFADREWKYGDQPDSLFASIKHGHPDVGMPAFEETFSDQEIRGLVAYIQQGMNQVAQYTFEEAESLPATYQAEQFTYRLDTVAIDFGEVPWSIEFLPDGGMLITEIGGTLYRRTPDGKLQEVSGVPKVQAEGQGGLLDIELHPNFSSNNLIFLSYSAVKEEGGSTLTTTAVMRARLEGNSLREQKVIFEAEPWSTTRHHYGSRLAFGPDGNLYFSVGDRGNHDENPQDLQRHPGKIHRIRDDGSIPADNPFSGQGNAKASIYSYGHRNPQGMLFHPKSGQLWEHEHGPRGGDEINVIEKGVNYGWPAISYGINYDGKPITDKTEATGMEQPLQQWTPSIAPSGMAFVTGNRYKGWEGSLLSGSLRFQYLNRSTLEGTDITAEEQLLKNIGRVRDVKMSPDGYIYLAVENPARIYRIVPVE
ncbi:glucose sorbosone dehydrogenase [Flammeovirgaceae bacterium 311]|nr:glucose sorbosone dehydrogenase [Flammeovirgaceae bacterium 311]